MREDRIDALLGAEDPARGLDATVVDLASDEATGGARLGRLLPLLAVLVLISGGSFAALSVFAGEREAGTLETLLVQPIDARAVAWGKFYAVLAVGLAALTCNVGSLFVSLAFGLGALPGIEGSEAGSVAVAAGGGRLALAALLFLPSAVLLSALLALASARARTFRSGQQQLVPLTIAAALPAAVAGFTELALDPLFALAPLLGSCLAVRDALRGTLGFPPAAIGFVSGVVYAALALRALVRRLTAERLLHQPSPARGTALGQQQARSAQAFGLVAALGSYLLGGWLQARFGLGGLLATLWLFLPLVAWLAARGTVRATGASVVAALHLGRARWHHLVGALLLAPALGGALRRLSELVQRVAPLPERLIEDASQTGLFEGLSPLGLFFVLALSPGVCEELCFRGAVLSGLKRGLSPARAVVFQALVFALAHASVHRFPPTFLVGLVLGAVTLRARSLWPAVALHVGYDGLLVLAFAVPWTSEPSLAWLALPGAWFLLRAPAPAPPPEGSIDAQHADSRGLSAPA